jgi:GrpB-like predicted nucleotidyltransferase (UPF0157 family)
VARSPAVSCRKSKLRIHPGAMEEYASLKRNAAKVANYDGKQYRKIKQLMFQKISAFIKELHDK